MDSKIFYLNSNKNFWINTVNCGTAWAISSCRENLAAYTQRDNLNQKAVFMVR